MPHVTVKNLTFDFATLRIALRTTVRLVSFFLCLGLYMQKGSAKKAIPRLREFFAWLVVVKTATFFAYLGK